jgi:hypothetical protein
MNKLRSAEAERCGIDAATIPLQTSSALWKWLSTNKRIWKAFIVTADGAAGSEDDGSTGSQCGSEAEDDAYVSSQQQIGAF